MRENLLLSVTLSLLILVMALRAFFGELIRKGKLPNWILLPAAIFCGLLGIGAIIISDKTSDKIGGLLLLIIAILAVRFRLKKY